MEDFEYREIIEKCRDKYHIDVSQISLQLLILFHKELGGDNMVSFDYLCDQKFLDEYCKYKYPGLNLYERVFSLYAQN